MTPTLGTASATSINKITFTTPATGSTLTIIDGKTLTANNTLAFSGTDGSTLNIGSGGTLGSNAFTSTAFYPNANPSNYIPLTALSSAALGLTYTNTTGVFSLTSGYAIPSTASQANWDTAYTNRITTLTTTGSSGAATLSANTLNIPTYTLTGLGGQPLSSTLTSLSGLAHAAGVLTNNGTGTFAYSTTPTLTGTNFSGIPNTALVNASITINGSAIPLGGSVANLALTTGTLSQFSPTTSLQLASLISDESGSGALVFANSPTLVTPTLGDATYTTLSGGGIIANGSVGIGTATPTALLHLNGGTNIANTAPLKFTSGVNLDTPESGAVEFDGTQLFFSPSTTRNILAQVSGSTALTVGSIPFATTDGYLTSSANLFWDNTNTRLGIGTATPNSELNINTTGLGVTINDGSGLNLSNTTAAINGLQQMSPTLKWSGRGWATTPLNSQDTSFISYVLPVQGTTNPSANLIFASAVNGSAYTTRLTLTSAGALTVGAGLSATTANLSSTLTGTVANFTGAVTTTQSLTTVPTNGFAATAGAALVGTPVRISPSVIWSGSGWNTTVTASAKTNAIEAYLLPTTGATTAGSLVFANRTVNGVANATEIMRLTTSGNVGIGATSPVTPLHVVSASNATIRLERTGGSAATYDIGVGDSRFSIGGTAFTILGTTNVGVNQQSPVSNHHVNTSASTSIGEIIQGSASQTADLSQWRDSTGATLTSIQSNGFLKIGSSASVGTFSTPAITFGSNSTGMYSDTNRFFFVAQSTFAGGFDSTGFIGNFAWVNATSSTGIDTPKMGGYRASAAGLQSGLSGTVTGDVGIVTGNVARIVALANGNVGINNPTPTANLHVTGTARIKNASGYGLDVNSSGTVTINTTTGATGLTISDTNNGIFDFTGGAQTWRQVSLGGGNFEIRDRNQSDATRFAIAGTTGNVGVGNSAPGYTLHVGSSSVTGIVSRFQNSTGTCDINPTTTSLSCSSDINLKKNITVIGDNTPFILNKNIINPQSTLQKVLSLTPVVYNWNTELDTDTKHVGFIAQEVEQIFPDLVAHDSVTGLKSVNYIGFIPYITKAVVEQNIKVTLLEDRVTALENTIKNTPGLMGGVMNSITDLVAGTLTVGSTEKRTGITLYDEVTGDPFCIKVINGQMQTIAGECTVVNAQVPTPSTQNSQNQNTAEESNTPLENTETIQESINTPLENTETTQESI